MWQIIITITMEICKVPTLRLKALNKHTHIMYIKMEHVIQIYIYVRCQTGVNIIALEHSRSNSISQTFFLLKTGDMKYLCVCRRTKLPVHSEVREIGRR